VDLSVTLAAAGAVLFAMSLLWLVSLAVRDASIVDITWGPLFVLISWVAYAVGDGSAPALLIAVLATAWGLRLGFHIGRRNIGHGEDPRYVRMREKRPRQFWLWSLFAVFIFQGLIALVVSLPIQSLAAVGNDTIGLVSWVGAAVFAIGLAFEAVGDAQLSRFKADPASRGQVMDRGLWRYTRHPNYFGDSVVWWGLWLLAVGSGAAWWTLVGPALMTFMLVKVSGVAMTEADIATRRPGYADYIRRTSAFVPMPPRKPGEPASP
jgi:steroid 5-alpha reductase family enzyme